MNREKVGQLIKERRIARLLTGEELAEACAIPSEILDSIESGGNGYEIGQLAKVCEYLGIDYGDGNAPKNKAMTHYNQNLGEFWGQTEDYH